MTTIPPIAHPLDQQTPPPRPPPHHGLSNDSDLEAEELFNQIQLEGDDHWGPAQTLISEDNKIDQANQPQQHQSSQQQQQLKINGRGKLKKHRMLDIDSEESIHPKNASKSIVNHLGTNKDKRNQMDKKQRKRLKKQKKLRKKAAKLGKLTQEHKSKPKLKKLRKQGSRQNEDKSENQNNKSQEWSGESSSSSPQQSDASNDSLLQRLNPTKRKSTANNKQRRTEEKEGFSLKQLGNDADNQYQNEDQGSGDESYVSKNKKKKKTDKGKDSKTAKEVRSNQQLLKSLLEIGLCVGEENESQNDRRDQEVDNGLEQVMNMKNSKKKGPKIANKLFADIQIQSDEEQNEQVPKNIELDIKPRVLPGLSSMTSSFLNKTEKLKKVRGMESELLQEEYQKIQSLKAKESMMKLINQKELEEAEEIVLDVKIPELVKGRDEINNSIFLKKVSSAAAPAQGPITSPAAGSSLPQIQKYGQYHSNSGKKQKQSESIKDKDKLKVSRLDFFKSITQEVKTRKSRDITNEAIKNTFKRTDLEEIEQMRKNNEQRKRRQNLREFSDEDEDGDEKYELEEVESNEQARRMNVDEQNEQKPNKLHQIMNFNIEVQNCRNGDVPKGVNEQPMDQQGQQYKANIVQNQGDKQVEEKNRNAFTQQQAEKFPMSVQGREQKKLSEEEYRKLIQMEEAVQLCEMQEENEQQQKNDESSSEQKENKINADLNKMELEYANNEQEELENENDKLLELEDDQIRHDELGNQREKVDIEVDIEVSDSYEQFASEQSEPYPALDPNVSDGKEEQQYQSYLNELEEEGIQIKKYNSVLSQGQLSLINEEKENSQQKENSVLFSTLNANLGNQLERKQFHKLRKLATILKQKRKKQYHIKKAGQFYDEEAEEGSDNEQHDGQAKIINYDEQNKQYEGLDLDADLEEFLDNAVDIDQENQDEAFRKYLEDVKIQDREELKRIMRGDFKRRNEGEPIIEEMEEDEKLRLKRMEEFEEYIKQKQMEDGKDLYTQRKSDEQSEQNESGEQCQNRGASKKAEKMQFEIEEVDEINEQNLARYLDDQYIDSKRTTTVIKKSIIQLPLSYQRGKKTEMRNTLKAKQSVAEICSNPLKLKKSSSHLNEMIMKNKEKIKPLVFIRNFAVLNKR